ncbi:MAG: M56 family metallopeptidase [Bacteroidota bacterium]
MPIDPNLIWMPLVLWSLAAALGAWSIDRFRHRLHPHTQHRFAWTLLLALPLMIGVAMVLHVVPLAHPLRLSIAVIPMGLPIYPGQPLVRDIGEAIGAVGLTWRNVGQLATMAIWLSMAAGAALTGWRWLRLQRWRRTLRPAEPEHLNPEVPAWERAAHLPKPVTYVISDEATTPMTFGWRRPVVVVPSVLIDDAKTLRAALTHEYTHIWRGDYASGLVQQAVRSAFVWHPVVRTISDQIDRSREILCDAEVLQSPDLAAQDYAALVCQLAVGTPRAMPVVCMAQARSSALLTQRIHAMKQHILPVSRATVRRSALVAVIAVSMLTGAAAIASGAAAQTQPTYTTVAQDVENIMVFHEEIDKLLRLFAEQTLTVQTYDLLGMRVGEPQTITLQPGIYQIQFEEPEEDKGDQQIFMISWEKGAVKTYNGFNHAKPSRTFLRSAKAVPSLQRVEVNVDVVVLDQD